MGFRDKNSVLLGPGPAKYNISNQTGQASFSYHCVKAPSWSCQARPMMDQDLRLAMERPAPGDYNVRGVPGKNSPILHGPLYDITCKFRLYNKDRVDCSPGPARYWIRGALEEYGLDQKIANVKVPRQRKPKAGTVVQEAGAEASSSSTAAEAQASEDVEPDSMVDAVDHLMATSATGASEDVSEARLPVLTGSSSAPAL